uniref:Protein kinase domain-containing protein n=1 Tax=Aegilops tauschii subsp. strangulata TaxID=200361 RepID=A0A453JY44_AEGTS
TTANVDVSKASSFDAPPVVLRSAATPVNGTRLEFSWSPDTSQNNDSSSAAYLLLLYFAELQQLPGNVLRRFDILVDGASWNGSRSYTPKYLSAEVVEQVVVQGSGQHTVSLVATPDAILPPILNAFEIYSLRQMTELATNNGDAKAMMGIRTTYMLKKNWMGDPCAPKAFAWNGLNCSYSSSGPAWITALQFSYKELKLITANFKEEIGRGGFGAVFLGYLENGSPVAVKIRSKTSSQGDREFLSEGGDLEDRLRGEVSVATPLSWHRRLKIALDSAHGLEYLHKSCQPPLIHRDVKTKNILLSADLDAKISDFGLTKVFADEFMTHITTQPAGTLGYLDPEYYNTSRLSEKSDVYSFGVVLLELITGQSPAVAITDTESIHIAQWVRQKLSEGNIESIADSKMGREYDVNSVWKVTELALQCKEQPSRERPTMTDVVAELKECLELEVSRGMGNYNSVTSGTSNLSATSTDSHNDAQANDLKQQSVLELGQVGDASPTHIGPAPR